MTRAIKALPIVILLALTGCNSAEVIDYGAGSTNGAAGKGDHGDALTPLERALLVLEDIAENGESEIQRALAGETVARIADRDVWIGSMKQARGVDLWHMCKDLMPNECGDRPEESTWTGSKEIREAIAAELDGYQWGNRLYFAFSDKTEPRDLASTLVHEVNHVLNRSECSYYKDFDTHQIHETYAFVEEFRAFFSECWLADGKGATVARCRNYAVETMEEREYDMTPDFEEFMPGELNPLEQMSEELVEARFWEDGSFGYLIPTMDNWPEDFEPCD
jgi:hypothetical protein